MCCEASKTEVTWQDPRTSFPSGGTIIWSRQIGDYLNALSPIRLLTFSTLLLLHPGVKKLLEAAGSGVPVYKALLFLGAGAVIHAVADNQDFRKYGGLVAFLPLSYTVMLVASLSLVAFPFMTGFYSKDLILESAYGGFHFSSVAVYFIATIGAMFTTLYSVKVLYLTFLTSANGPLRNYKGAHEGDVFMSLPLIILGSFSIFFGYMTKDMFIGMGTGFFTDNSLFTHPLHEIMLETEFAVPLLFKLLPLFITVTASALSLVYSEFLPKPLINLKLTRVGYNIFGFFNTRFLVEAFYNKYVVRFILRLGGQTTKVLDKGFVERLGPYGLETGLTKLSRSLGSLDTGVITSYALYILIGLILYIVIPYVTLLRGPSLGSNGLLDISILLCTIAALLGITLNTLSPGIAKAISLAKHPHPFVGPPKPHASVSLPLKNGLFSPNSLKSIWVAVVVSALIYISYRLPARFMLDQLGLLAYLPLLSLVFTLCSFTIIAGLSQKEVSRTQLAWLGFWVLF